MSSWNFILLLLTCNFQNSHLKGIFISGELIYKSSTFLWSYFISCVYSDLDLVLPIADEFSTFFLLIFPLGLSPANTSGNDWNGFSSDFPSSFSELLNKIWLVVPGWTPTYLCGRAVREQRKSLWKLQWWKSGVTQKEFRVIWSKKYPSPYLWNEKLLHVEQQRWWRV